jgi:hypothetical protein
MRFIQAKGVHPVMEGVRLGFWNLAYIIVSAATFLAALLAASLVNDWLPLAIPFSALIMLLLLPVIAVGYFWLWLRYAITYAGLVAQHRVGKTLLVGGIAVWPNVLFMWLIRHVSASAPESCGDIVWALGYFIFLASSVVMPLWGLVALSLPPKKEG